MPGLIRPPNHTALAVLPAVVLDLETTGLNVKQDRIVQIGAVTMTGGRVDEDSALDILVNPGLKIPESATAIHGIGDLDVADAAVFSQLAERIKQLLAGKVVIGHNIDFDLAVLRHEAYRIGFEWHDPVSLDLAMIYGSIEPGFPDLGLDQLADNFGVEIKQRHTALGDCLATAEIVSRVMPLLQERDIRTLGELLTYIERRADLKLRYAEAGWYDNPATPARRATAAPAARIDSHLYSRRLKDVMNSPVQTIDPAAVIRDAATIMAHQRIGALIAVDAQSRPLGILTERDILKFVSDPGNDSDTAHVSTIMTSPVHVMTGDEMLYRALGRMDRLGIRHLCIVDENGAASGMISQRDLVRHRAQAAVELGDRLSQANDAQEMIGAYQQLPNIAARLLAEGLTGIDVARLVSNELQGACARAADLVAANMSQHAHRPGDGQWCLVVLGSAGRGESLLGADQDNALIYRDAADEDQERWFADFGQQVAELLDQTGIPLCQGGVMAANTPWRTHLDEWRVKVQTWLNRARPEDLLNVDIFFDLRPVAGDPSLAYQLHSEAVAAASKSPTFLGLLAESVVGLATSPVGLFGRIRTEEGRVDLKRTGLLPLVSIARALALRCGSAARATPARFKEATAAGRISEGDAHTLIRIHGDLLTYILRQQLIDLEAGQRPSNRVDLNNLHKTELSGLRRDLRALNSIVGGLRGNLAR